MGILLSYSHNWVKSDLHHILSPASEYNNFYILVLLVPLMSPLSVSSVIYD